MIVAQKFKGDFEVSKLAIFVLKRLTIVHSIEFHMSVDLLPAITMEMIDIFEEVKSGCNIYSFREKKQKKITMSDVHHSPLRIDTHSPSA